jgi:hypothetical protein
MIIDFKVDCPIATDGCLRKASDCLTCKYSVSYDGKSDLDVRCNAIEEFLKSSTFQGFLVNHMEMTVKDALRHFIEIDRYDP